jgi:hypothetical protein
MELVKGGDALGGSLAKESVEHSKRLPCPLDAQPRDLLDLAVESHGNSHLPRAARS